MFERFDDKFKAKQVESSASRLQGYLANGWTVRGYSTCMLAMGGLTHSVLLELQGHLITHTTLVINGKADGSNEICLTSAESIE